MKKEEKIARRDGIGGSDAAAICGLDPFRTPMQVWLDKCGMIPIEEDDAGDSPARWGKILEDPVIAEFERRQKLWVLERQAIVRNLTIPYMRATLDGLVYPDERVSVVAKPLGVFEGKTASARSWEWRDPDEPSKFVLPDRVEIQVQHNMAVTGLDKTWVAALLMHPSPELAIFEVARDEESIKTLIEIEGTFWASVVKRVPPPVDGAYGTHDALRKAYPNGDPSRSVELGQRGLELAERRKLIQRKLAGIMEERNTIDAEIMSLLGEAEVGTGTGVPIVTWKAQNRQVVDTDWLKKERPDCASIAIRTNRVRVLNYKRV